MTSPRRVTQHVIMARLECTTESTNFWYIHEILKGITDTTCSTSRKPKSSGLVWEELLRRISGQKKNTWKPHAHIVLRFSRKIGVSGKGRVTMISRQMRWYEDLVLRLQILLLVSRNSKSFTNLFFYGRAEWKSIFVLTHHDGKKRTKEKKKIQGFLMKRPCFSNLEWSSRQEKISRGGKRQFGSRLETWSCVTTRSFEKSWLAHGTWVLADEFHTPTRISFPILSHDFISLRGRVGSGSCVKKK